MAVNNIDSSGLGNMLTEYLRKGYAINLSLEFPNIEYAKMKLRVNSDPAKTVDYYLVDKLGHAASQMQAVGRQQYPKVRRAEGSRKTMTWKRIDTTIGLNADEFRRAAETRDAKFAEPLRLELDAKQAVQYRVLAKQFWGDGTGVMATVSSASVSSNVVTVVFTETGANLDWGGTIRNIEEGDEFIAANQDGTAVSPTVTGTFYAFRCESVNESTNTATFRCINADGDNIACSDDQLAANDVFYRVGQGSGVDLTADFSSIDLGTLTNNMMGLYGLSDDSGLLVQDILHSGAFAGTVEDLNNAAFSWNYVQSAVSKAKHRVGRNRRLVYDNFVCAYELKDYIVGLDENARVLDTYEDPRRGQRVTAYKHGDMLLVLEEDPFIPKKAAFCIPKMTIDKDLAPIEFHYTPIECEQDLLGNTWHLAPGSGTHYSQMLNYSTGYMNMCTTYPATIVRFDNIATASL